MSRLRAALVELCCRFANPKRGELWQCPKCNTWNEPDRGSCMNGCR